ncbi:MAG: [FeFe] hydrogenase H-cluster radical SAM maturase HydE [Defluviitaleaceae bacterium]|nr:[FeFe] hydrogenase H-cluster radical SAM maturase HydE [Defluviitaleaceae bacterium]
MIEDILAKSQTAELTFDDMLTLINLTKQSDLDKLYAAAYATKEKHVGKKAYYRGLIEFSNVCVKDCYYCGIRKSSAQERYSMTKDEILEMAIWAYKNNYGSVTIQSGERQDAEYCEFVADIIAEISNATNGKLAMTICLGEQSLAVYQKWFDNGATRYLLRMETTNPALYKKIHPDTPLHSFENRLNCLKVLRQIGYQVGTGVMIGLPGQTPEDMVNDIVFYKQNDVDMIGMGPYVVHKNTPMGQNAPDDTHAQVARFNYGLKMIAITRLHLKDVNIAATTALQALHPLGREMGLKAGANILMPIITLQDYRNKYQLYDNKPCIDDTPEHCKTCLTNRVESVGDVVGFAETGDSVHFLRRKVA